VVDIYRFAKRLGKHLLLSDTKVNNCLIYTTCTQAEKRAKSTRKTLIVTNQLYGMVPKRNIRSLDPQ